MSIGLDESSEGEAQDNGSQADDVLKAQVAESGQVLGISEQALGLEHVRGEGGESSHESSEHDCTSLGRERKPLFHGDPEQAEEKATDDVHKGRSPREDRIGPSLNQSGQTVPGKRTKATSDGDEEEFLHQEAVNGKANGMAKGDRKGVVSCPNGYLRDRLQTCPIIQHLPDELQADDCVPVSIPKQRLGHEYAYITMERVGWCLQSSLRLVRNSRPTIGRVDRGRTAGRRL